MENKKYEKAKRVSLVTIIINIALSIVKLLAGVLGKSSAMLADGVHTLSDVLTTVLVLVGIKIGSKKADKNHPYGHEKFESVFAKLLSLILVVTGVLIGYESIKILISRDFREPGKIALYAALASILAKELMYRYTIRAAKEIKSTSMEADAWHHRSDALSSVGTFIGILGARMGFPALDPIAGIIVSVLVIKVGGELYLRSISELVDESADLKTIEEIETRALDVKGVEAINEIKTRKSGSMVYVDMSIAVMGCITVDEGHDIATAVHDSLEVIDEVKHCMVHVEPIFCGKCRKTS